MEHPNRFDSNSVDPIQLKPALAKLANSTMTQLWIDSPMKDRISIGCHNLEFAGTHDSIFKDKRTNRWDGLHFYGPLGRKTFTKSVLDIIKGNVQELHKSTSTSKTSQNVPNSEKDHPGSSQPRHQQRMYNQEYHPSVQVNNRFNVFNSNSGNQ